MKSMYAIGIMLVMVILFIIQMNAIEKINKKVMFVQSKISDSYVCNCEGTEEKEEDVTYPEGVGS